MPTITLTDDLNRLLGPSSARRKSIDDALRSINRLSEHQMFKSVFGDGINIFSPPDQGQATCLLVAHYDGDTAHDNAGGVLLALDILRRSSEHATPMAALFTDMEEVFQQGAAAFLRNLRAHGDDRIAAFCPVVCIDGIGGGDSMLLRTHDRAFSYSGTYLRMDADVFREAGHPTFTAFTGLDCIKDGHGSVAAQAIAIETNAFDIYRWMEGAGEILATVLPLASSLPDSWIMYQQNHEETAKAAS